MNLRVEKGCFRYKRGETVLDGISFSFDSPGILSILGANGAGKTTLLRCILGLLPWSSGASFLEGKDIRGCRQREFWSRVGYVPQARQPVFAYTIRELVILGRNPHLGPFAQPGERDWAAADRCLEQVGIGRLGGKLCTQVSGGEYQLALIARALAAEPSLLVLDEPESSLDFKNQMVVLETLKRLAEGGVGVVINTHYPEHAAEISRKALLLMPGGGAMYGDTEEILREENLERAFGIPVRVRKIFLPEKEHTCVIPLFGKPIE